MIILRQYQEDLITRVRSSMASGHRSPLIVSPCGSGKTVVFSAFTQRAINKGRRVLILAHREELLDQIGETLSNFKVRHEFIASGRNFYPNISVQVASVFSMARRLNKIIPPDLIIIDESHHAIKGSTWFKVFNHYPNAWKIGVTATPQRLGGESLGDVFDDMILGPSVSDLIQSGSLSKYKIFAPSSINTSDVHMIGGDFNKQELNIAADKPSITGDAIKHYKKYSDGKRAVVFCVSVDHAKHVAEQFRLSGYSSSSIDGKIDKFDRRKIVSDFKEGSIKILTSCDIISEGFDIPAIEVAIMLRPTASLALWIQQSGRALRPYKGKEHAIILDHAGNTMRHGLPDEPRQWSLEGAQTKNKQKASAVSVKICERCFGAQSSRELKCKICGYEFPVVGRKIEEKEGDLVEIDPEKLRRERISEQGKALTREELYALAVKRNYRNPRGWVHIIMQARQAKKNKGIN